MTNKAKPTCATCPYFLAESPVYFYDVKDKKWAWDGGHPQGACGALPPTLSGGDVQTMISARPHIMVPYESPGCIHHPDMPGYVRQVFGSPSESYKELQHLLNSMHNDGFFTIPFFEQGATTCREVTFEDKGSCHRVGFAGPDDFRIPEGGDNPKKPDTSKWDLVVTGEDLARWLEKAGLSTRRPI